MKQIGFIEPNADWELIPMHCRESLEKYILYGVPVGDFLAAVICNDLRGAVSRADENNLPRLKDYIVFLYQYAPAKCWGDSDRHIAWLRLGIDARREEALRESAACFPDAIAAARKWR